MKAYIEPPRKIPVLLKIGIWIAESMVGKRLMAARILAWYPRAAVGAGILESLVAHDEGRATKRLLKLIRMQVSFSASCPFCIDMNSAGFSRENITDDEVEALQGMKEPGEIQSFNDDERAALEYARALTSTPIKLDNRVLEDVLGRFNEKEIVVIASTIAQVNFWTRLIQGVGVPPSGFSETCSVLRLEDYSTLTGENSRRRQDP